MADETPDHATILQLDPSLIIAAVRPGTGQLDAMTGAVLDQHFVYECAVVIRVDPANGNGQLAADGLQPFYNQGLLLGQQQYSLVVERH